MKKIIIKVGTGVLTNESDGQLNSSSLVKLVTAIADISKNGYQVILVSSGAVGAGISGLGLKEYPADVPTRQACAAVGQTRLMHAYENLFRNFGISVAQLLLTADDLNDVSRSGRVRDTLARLSEIGNIIPIINENDSVAVEEISVGDNDMLSARVATLLGVDMLVLMSTIDGLIAPETNEVVREIADIDTVLNFARGDRGKFSIGGMATKLQAVKRSVDAGIETVIMNGARPDRLADVVAGAESGLCSRFKAK